MLRSLYRVWVRDDPRRRADRGRVPQRAMIPTGGLQSPLIHAIIDEVHHPRPIMILSQASRLSDRATVWVARQNDDSSFNRLTVDYGRPATVWSAQFADVHSQDVKIPVI